MKKHFTTILLILVLIAGLSLLLYPTVSDWWNSFHQSQAIVDYEHIVADMDEEAYQKMLSDARAYNEKLLERGDRFKPLESELAEYNSLLDLTGTGIMGYIDIPEIQVSLPIYHGTSEAVLSAGIGHIQGSSLPVGGESTHCVLSGHRGLPSAKLFTNLDKIAEGDTFIIHVMKDVLTYEVDKIRIVEPQEINDLMIEQGKDYCTLVTCTPYGINSHRLLVRGHRIENAHDNSDVRVTSDALQIEPIVVAPVIAAPILLILVIIVFFKPAKKKK